MVSNDSGIDVPSIFSEEFVLENHVVSVETSLRRKQLMEQWGDDRIYDSTERAAVFVLMHKRMEKVPGKGAGVVYIPIGKTLFFWDRQNFNLLHAVSEEEKKYAFRILTILADGTLHYNGQFFASPQEFLDMLTRTMNFVYMQIPIIPDKGLDLVLRGTFHSGFDLYYPPDFPPLLVAFTLANEDFDTAAKVLEHPTNEDPLIPAKKGMRKVHLMASTIEFVIARGYHHFFDYLLKRYALLNPLGKNFLDPMISAVRCGKRKMIIRLFGLYPADHLPKMYSTAIITAIQFASPELLSWLLDQIDESISLNVDDDKLIEVLSMLYQRFDEKLFLRTSSRICDEIPWDGLLAQLVKGPQDHLQYLHSFNASGGDVGSLEPMLKAKLISRIVRGKKTIDEMRQLLDKYPALLEDVNDGLLQSLDDAQAIKLMLELGAKPTEEHFERLLQISDLGPARLDKFLLLLSAIETIEEGKQSLSLASSFGDKAMAAAMEKFPELFRDKQFLLRLLNNTWKGAMLAADKMTTDMISFPAAKKLSEAIETAKPLPLAANRAYQFPAMSASVTLEILSEVLMPAGEIDKIKTALLQKPELCVDFWFRCLFNVQQEYIGSQWDALANETLPLIDEGRRFAFLTNCFHYFNLPLANLWIRHFGYLTDLQAIGCFNVGLPSGDPAVVDILADVGHLQVTDELGNSLLHITAKENAWRMMSRLIEKGADLKAKNQAGHTPYDMALMTKHLSACCILRGEKCLDEISEMLVGTEALELESWLNQAFLNSFSVNMLQLFEILRRKLVEKPGLLVAVDRAEKFLRNSGTLIVRYPRFVEQNEVYRGYNTGQASYEELQCSWGRQCEELYQVFYAEFKSQEYTLLEVMMKFAKPRSKLKGYEAWRMGYIDQRVGLVTYICGRYFSFWPLAMKVYKDLLNDPSKYQNTLKITDKGYAVTFTPEGGPLITLSSLEIKNLFARGQFLPRMIHTFTSEIKMLLPYLSKLFEKIKNYPRDPNDKAIPSELSRMIALFYWLGSHAAITERGNSQYMLMLLRLLYNLHGFQAGPWSPLYVQPDCIAIMLPFDRFYEEYYHHLFDFEPNRS